MSRSTRKRSGSGKPSGSNVAPIHVHQYARAGGDCLLPRRAAGDGRAGGAEARHQRRVRVEAHGLPRVLADEVDVAGARRGLRAGELVRAPQQLVDGEDGEARRGVHRADPQPGDVAAHPVVVRPRPLGALHGDQAAEHVVGVTIRGGAYLFMPGMKALRYLSDPR